LCIGLQIPKKINANAYCKKGRPENCRVHLERFPVFLWRWKMKSCSGCIKKINPNLRYGDV
jgi:hypothetical protein